MMTGKDISQLEIRKAGNKEFYFIFRLPSDGMFVSVFFDSMSETMVAVESAKGTPQRKQIIYATRSQQVKPILSLETRVVNQLA